MTSLRESSELIRAIRPTARFSTTARPWWGSRRVSQPCVRRAAAARFLSQYAEGRRLPDRSIIGRNIRAGVDDWCEFLCGYHQAVLVWVGGNKKVDGRTPTAEAVADRISLIRRAIDTLFAAAEFDTRWTYIT